MACPYIICPALVGPAGGRDYATLTGSSWPFGQDVIGDIDIEISARGDDADPIGTACVCNCASCWDCARV